MTPINAALDLLKSLGLRETPNYTKILKSTVIIEVRYYDVTEVFKVLQYIKV